MADVTEVEVERMLTSGGLAVSGDHNSATTDQSQIVIA
jgi:hypothetical protein